MNCQSPEEYAMFSNKTLPLLLTILLIAAGSCDILDDQAPQQSLPLDEAFNNKEALNSALIGAYSDLQDDEGDVAGANWTLFPSIMADNTLWNGSFVSYRNIAVHEMEPSNPAITAWWIDSYEVINDVNAILSAIPNVDGTSPSLKGEALFIRGITYFELVRVFAKPWDTSSDNSHPGVPIVTDPTESSDDFTFPSRATVAKVYGRVVTDLSDAIDLLPEANADGRATKYAAQAYLVKVFMHQGKYQKAAAMAQQVINGPYSLNEDVVTFFRNEFSGESIFEIANTTQDNPGTNDALPTFFNLDARDDIQISQSFIEALDTVITADQKQRMNVQGYTYEDTRNTMLLTASQGDDAQIPEAGSDNTTKYEDAVNLADNAPLLRLADIILLRAEALAEANGINDESINLLNQVRTRAIIVRDQNGDPVSDEETYIGYDQADFDNAQELIDAIMLERRIELAFEGQRMHDLVRKGRAVRGTAPGADNLIFPIPQRELDANSNLEQNPGY